MQRLVIYKQLERERERERERLLYRRFSTLLTAYVYNIRLQKENCSLWTMKTKRDRIGVRLQTENFIRKHIFCLGRRLYVIDHAMITVDHEIIYPLQQVSG